MSDLATPLQQEPKDPPDVRFVLNVMAVFLAAIVGLTFLQVTLRYFVGAPLSWGEELARYIFVWITFAGGAVAFARGSHIRVTAMVERGGPRFARLAWHFRHAVELTAIGVLLYTGAIVAWRYRVQSFYSLPDAPLVVFPLAIPVSALFMVWFYIRYVRQSRA